MEEDYKQLLSKMDKELAKFLENPESVEEEASCYYRITKGLIYIHYYTIKPYFDIYYHKNFWVGGRQRTFHEKDMPATAKVLRELRQKYDDKEYWDMKKDDIEFIKDVTRYLEKKNEK